MCKNDGTVIPKNKWYNEILDKKLAKIKEACPTIYANAEIELESKPEYLKETIAYKEALYSLLKHLDETNRFIYIFDYSRYGIYKILLSIEKEKEIEKELIANGYIYDKRLMNPETGTCLTYEDILHYYGFKESDCSYMIGDEDLEIRLITKPLK